MGAPPMEFSAVGKKCNITLVRLQDYNSLQRDRACGVSGNKTGISVYILGLKDKKYLAKTYEKK